MLTPQEASHEAGARPLREPAAARRAPRARTESAAKSTEPGSVDTGGAETGKLGGQGQGRVREGEAKPTLSPHWPGR